MSVLLSFGDRGKYLKRTPSAPNVKSLKCGRGNYAFLARCLRTLPGILSPHPRARFPGPDYKNAPAGNAGGAPVVLWGLPRCVSEAGTLRPASEEQANLHRRALPSSERSGRCSATRASGRGAL